MSNLSPPLSLAERDDLIARLIAIRDQIDGAGQMLAAIHVTHALDCLTEHEQSSQ